MNLVVASIRVLSPGFNPFQVCQLLAEPCADLGFPASVKYSQNHFIVALQCDGQGPQPFYDLFSAAFGAVEVDELLDVPCRESEKSGVEFSELTLFEPHSLSVDALRQFIQLYKGMIILPRQEHFTGMLQLVFASEYVNDYLYPAPMPVEYRSKRPIRAMG